MSAELIGTLGGLVFGIVNFGLLRWVAHQMEQASDAAGKPNGAPRVIRMVALADILLFAIVGYFLGPLVLTGP